MKRRKKRRIVCLAAAAITACLLTGFALAGQAAGQEESGGKIAAGNNEKLVYGTLTSVVGNEIGCLVTDTGETAEYEIPVGTTVTTRLGTETTFARLSKGNRVALLLEQGTDKIKAVRIVE